MIKQAIVGFIYHLPLLPYGRFQKACASHSSPFDHGHGSPDCHPQVETKTDTLAKEVWIFGCSSSMCSLNVLERYLADRGWGTWWSIDAETSQKQSWG